MSKKFFKNLPFILAVSLLMWAVILSPLWAATYYVSNSATNGAAVGDDGNNGTSLSTPWLTVTPVNALTLTAGDSVLFNSGDTFTGQLQPDSPYWDTPTVTYGKFGSGANPIISNTGGPALNVITNSGSSIIQDLTFIRNASTAGQINATFAPITKITIQRCKFVTSGTYDYGQTFLFYSDTQPISGVIFTGNELTSTATGTSNALVNVIHSSAPVFDLTISNNNLHDNSGQGFFIMGDRDAPPNDTTTNSAYPYGIDFNGNTFTNLGMVAIQTNSGLRSPSNHQSYIRNNTFTNIGTVDTNVDAVDCQYCDGVIISGNYINGVLSGDGNGSGIDVDWAWTSDTYISTNNQIFKNRITGVNHNQYCTAIIVYKASGTAVYQNILWDNGVGIENANSVSTGNTFYNNTAYGNSYGGFLSSTVTASAATTWKNNIFSGNSVGCFGRSDGTVTAPTETYNLCYGTVGPYTLDVTDKTTDPLFVSTVTPDFHLLPSSPAINAGVNVGLASDYDGRRVPQGAKVDIGAYEFPLSNFTFDSP